MRRLLPLLLVLAGLVAYQATHIHTSGTLPTNCTVGDIYLKTGSGIGFYTCTATNSWDGPLTTATAGNIQTLLDGISTTQGVIIYYNGTDWVALSPGTSGQFLQTQGASANPQWATGSGGGTGDLLDWQYVEKTADEMVESSVTLQNDDHLVLALGTNQTWRLTMHLFLTTENNNEAPDFLGGWTLPTGATISFTQNCMSNSATGVGSHAPFFASNYQSSGGAAGILCGILSTVDTPASPVFVEGVVKTGGTSGNLQLQWAQNSSNADGTIVKAESNMFMRRTQ